MRDNILINIYCVDSCDSIKFEHWRNAHRQGVVNILVPSARLEVVVILIFVIDKMVGSALLAIATAAQQYGDVITVLVGEWSHNSKELGACFYFHWCVKHKLGCVNSARVKG